jgi:hypothetical protein
VLRLSLLVVRLAPPQPKSSIKPLIRELVPFLKNKDLEPLTLLNIILNCNIKKAIASNLKTVQELYLT